MIEPGRYSFMVMLVLAVVVCVVSSLEGAAECGFTSEYESKEYVWNFLLVEPVKSEEAMYSDEIIDLSFSIHKSKILFELMAKTDLILNTDETVYVPPEGGKGSAHFSVFSVAHTEGEAKGKSGDKNHAAARTGHVSMVEIAGNTKVTLGFLPGTYNRMRETAAADDLEQNLFSDRASSFLRAQDPFLPSEHVIIFNPMNYPGHTAGGSYTGGYYMSSDTVIRDMVRDLLDMDTGDLFPGDPLDYEGKTIAVNLAVNHGNEQQAYRFMFQIHVSEKSSQ